MAVKTWIGNAHAVKQISTITVANTWAAGDTATLTINTKDLVVTVGATGTSTANVAIAIQEAWMAATRLDGSSSTDATSNFGGQEFGEFCEATATVSGSVVTIIANEAGKPFTLTVTEATAGSGTATGATAQAATGPNHWDNADNWDTGTVPANDDTVVFRDTDISCKYGLPNGSLEVTVQVWMSFAPTSGRGHEAWIGLPQINTDITGKPYNEYRQRYVRLDDAGGGTDIAHRFGLGKDGNGSPLINLKHSTLKCSPIVYNTGLPQIPGKKALNICCTANTSTLKIFNGSVDFSSQDGGTSAFVTVTQNSGDSRGVTAIHTTGGTFIQSGGTALIGGAGAINVLEVHGGTLRTENQTGDVTGISVFVGAVIDWASSGDIGTANVLGGTLDMRNCPGCEIGTLQLYRGSKFIDPFASVTIGTGAYVFYDPTDGLVLGSSEINTRLRIV